MGQFTLTQCYNVYSTLPTRAKYKLRQSRSSVAFDLQSNYEFAEVLIRVDILVQIAQTRIPTLT